VRAILSPLSPLSWLSAPAVAGADAGADADADASDAAGRCFLLLLLLAAAAFLFGGIVMFWVLLALFGHESEVMIVSGACKNGRWSGWVKISSYKAGTRVLRAGARHPHLQQPQK